jgi:hypothetical protein
MLPEDDCHFDLRKQVHSKLQKENVAINDLVNVSLAWDWSFLGETPEGINREMTSTLEFALRNRGFLKPKQSLAIPKLSFAISLRVVDRRSPHTRQDLWYKHRCQHPVIRTPS